MENQQKKLNLFLVDDHAIFLEGLISLLEKNEKYQITGTAVNAEQALEKTNKKTIDVLICDLNLPGMDGLELVRIIKKQQPEMKAIMLSMHDEVDVVREAFNRGVDGYVLKKDSHLELKNAIDSVLYNSKYISKELNSRILSSVTDEFEKPFLTEREIQVLKLIAIDITNKEIADRLNISVRTVETHRKNLMYKTGANSVVGLINFAYKNKLIE